MKALIFAPKATIDIDQIYDYTEQVWGFDQAEAYTFGIRDFCNAIALGQRRGRSIADVKPGYLALSYQSHFIVYRETSVRIVIVRVSTSG